MGKVKIPESTLMAGAETREKLERTLTKTGTKSIDKGQNEPNSRKDAEVVLRKQGLKFLYSFNPL